MTALEGADSESRPGGIRRVLPFALLGALGITAALLMNPDLQKPYADPQVPQMRPIAVNRVLKPDIIGRATGNLDRVVQVPGGYVAYGWVVWPSPESPMLSTVSSDTGPALAYERPDVVAAIGDEAESAGFQILLPSAEVPCLLLSEDQGFRTIPGTPDEC